VRIRHLGTQVLPDALRRPAVSQTCLESSRLIVAKVPEPYNGELFAKTAFQIDDQDD
jgi:hypothetical protein